MRVKKTMSRAARLICAVLMLVSLLIPEQAPMVSNVQAVTQEEIDKLKKEAAELAKQQSSIKSTLSELKNDRSKALEQLNLLDQQIANTEQQIAVTEQQIALTQQQIDGYEAQLAQTEYELSEIQRQQQETYELFCRRARAMEEEGTPSFWSVLFQATSFSDLLSRLSDVQVVIDYDQSIMNELNSLEQQISEKLAYQQELKSSAEAAKLTQEEQKAALDEQKAELDQQRQEAIALVAEIQSNVDIYASQLKAIEDEEEAIQKEIIKKNEELAKQLQMEASVGGYIWPVTTSRRITSDYGGRNTGIPGASTNHKGVDIGGVFYNSKVVATKDGIVITSKYVSSYGNYVVISHGNGNTTLYAHLSSRSVKEGDKVKQGQVIGITGSTGISNGPHLHYEIVENGVRVDPKKYLPGWIKAW